MSRSSDVLTRSLAPPAVDAAIANRIREDAETFRGIAAGLESLEAAWTSTRPLIEARQRGYFTPDEDDRARQLLLSYRNNRIGLWDVISRSLNYREMSDPREQLLRFILGYASGLLLYRRSLQFIATYEHEPLLRAKFNEPDPGFGLPPGFFDEVLTHYTSLTHLSRLRQGHRFWRRHRRAVRALGIERDPDWAPILLGIRQDRVHVRQLFQRVLRLRLKHDWRFFLRSLLRPFTDRARRLRESIGGAFGHIQLSGSYAPSITPAVIETLRSVLECGDILLVRGDGRLTAALLPGFWTHAAIYLGTQGDLAGIGFDREPAIAPHWDRLAALDNPFGMVLEGVAPRSTLNPLARCLEGDHVLVIRPVIPPEARRDALVEAFRLLNRPYDFDFDFTSGHHLVCTELVYRSFHGRGGIGFPLVKRLGRFTLTGDDIVDLALGTREIPMSPLRIVQGLLNFNPSGPRLLAPQELFPKIRAIRKGWRPF